MSVSVTVLVSQVVVDNNAHLTRLRRPRQPESGAFVRKVTFREEKRGRRPENQKKTWVLNDR